MTNAAKRKGGALDPAKLTAKTEAIARHFDGQSDAFYTSGRLLDQGMIDPRDTRNVVGFCLQTCDEARLRVLRPNVYGVARP